MHDLFLKVADEVGDLLIHCRYGCKPKEDCLGEYEVDPGGKNVQCCYCTHFCLWVMSIILHP